MPNIDPNVGLMTELTPEVERLYKRHLGNTKEWYPHELIPYDLGRDYSPENGWSPEDYPLPDGVRSALLINLLTEDNLPYYYETISGWSPSRDHPWGIWTRQWTSEEHRGKDVMTQVAADEYLHHVFYRDLSTAAFVVDPSAMVIAAFAQIKTFEMPGTGIVDFKTHAKAIASEGIYDFARFKEGVVDPTLKAWDIENLEGLSSEAELARDGLMHHLERLDKVVARQRDRQAEKAVEAVV